MNLLVCAIRDKAAEAFLPPLFFRSIGEAVRAFETAVLTDGHQFQKNASDYSLYRLGDWDDNSGLFTPRDPEIIMNALQVSQS